MKVVKNKVAPPFRQTEFQIMYGKGIHRLGEIIDLGVKLNLIDKSGAWYAYKGDKIGQGKKNASIYLEENIALAEELEASIRNELLADPRKTKGLEEDALKEKEIPANDDIVVLADVK